VPRYVITLVGEDRSGLVSAVADAVSAHGGNWEGSQLAERAGVFAGVIEISVTADSAPGVWAALRALDDRLTVTAVAGAEQDSAGTSERRLVISLVANDRPGIVRDVSAALAAHGLSIDEFTTEVRDAAMAGGRLFEASALAHAAPSTDLAAVRDDLERLAAELQVEITVADR
jgi:glycine cleavage system regulatory protein